MLKRNIILLVLICISFTLKGQSVRLFSTDKDLSNSLVTDVFQDQKGYMWIATEDGLNRFDGSRMTTYRHIRGDSKSLSSSFVQVIAQSKDGHLFVGCNNGLQFYNYETDDFTQIPIYQDGLQTNKYVRTILECSNDSILIGVSGGGLQILNFINGEPKTRELDGLLESHNIIHLFEDNKTNIWIVTEDHGIYRLDLNGKNQKNYFSEKNNPYRHSFTCISQDKNGNIFAGSLTGGLFIYDRAKDDFIHIPYSSSKLPVKTLMLGNDNNTYIGTDGEGVKMYNPQKQTIEDCNLDVGALNLNRMKIHCMTQDRSGNMWLGIYQKGVILRPAKANTFKYIGYESLARNIGSSSSVTSITRDHQGHVWIGTDNDGVYRWNMNEWKYTHYVHSNNVNSVPTTVLCIFEDSNKDIWMGSYLDEMCRFDSKSGKYIYLSDILPIKNADFYKRVFHITEDNHRNLWIGTMGFGIWSLNLDTHETKQYTTSPTSAADPREDCLQNEWIYSLLVSRDDKLYMATTNGLSCLDLKNNSFTSTLGENRICPYRIIYSLCEDSQGNIWMGSSTGLFCYDIRSKKLKQYTTKEGLPNDVICGIEEDWDHNLWISTYNGLSKFDLKSNTFSNYFYNDGLQGNEFSRNAVFKDVNGDLYFGGMNGVSYFNPRDIINEQKKIDVHISGLYIHDRNVTIGMKSGRYEILNSSITEAKTFNLNYTDNSFGIEFSSFSFVNPNQITYMYSIDNETWISLQNGINRVSFSNLNPGRYHFRVKAIGYNIDSDIKEIEIVIHPAWYASWWAYCIYAAFVVLCVFLVIRYLQIRHQQEIKLKDSEYEKEINEVKLQFFINISHEVRTPLSLIIDPLERLMKSDDDPKRQETYMMIHRNSNRILQLINQLMDIRKIDKGQMRLQFRETDMVGFLDNLYNLFEFQAEKKQIEFTFPHDMDRLNVWIDVQNFDKIVMNILSNAFKFTPDRGKIEMKLTTGKGDMPNAPASRYFEIRITDTGIGIQNEEKERIFSRFYQINDKTSNYIAGTGVGLHLAQSLVELHHGVIFVEENREEQGSSFVIRIPLGNTHLNMDEIRDNIRAVSSKTEVPSLLPQLNETEEEKLKARYRYRIMVVEDDDEIRKYMCQELSTDYRIIESVNGKDALEKIYKKEPDLVISDIMMPEMDGITLCNKIKGNINLNHIPVILLTAKVREEDNIEGLDVGADAYIHKPFSLNILRSTVQNIIKNREVLRNKYSGNQLQEDKVQKVSLKSNDERLMERIMKVINREMANAELNVEMIASEVGISRVHLHRKLKELTNQTTRDFIRNIRLKQAAELLSSKHLNITEVAYAVGFNNLVTFSIAFKQMYGVSPKEYMEQHKKEDERES